MKSNRNSYCLILILDLDIPRIFKDCLCWHKLLRARNCHLAFFLLKIFNHELFGAIAEEKEVKQILSKVMEARRSKSYDSYEILGKFVGKDQVTKLILPLKEVRT